MNWLGEETKVSLRHFGLFGGRFNILFGHNTSIDLTTRTFWSWRFDRVPGQIFISLRIGQRFVDVDIL